ALALAPSFSDGGIHCRRDFAHAHVPAIVFRGGRGVHQPAQEVDGSARLHAGGDELSGEIADAVVEVAPDADVVGGLAPIVVATTAAIVGLGTVGRFLAGGCALVAEIADEQLHELLDQPARFALAGVASANPGVSHISGS